MALLEMTVEMERVRSQARDVARIAESRGCAMPDGWHAAVDVQKQAEKIAAEPEPVAVPAVLPTEKIDTWCTRQATALARWRDRVSIARQLAERAERDAVRIALDTAAAVVVHLVDDVNATLVPQFEQLLAAAPRTLTGYENAEQLQTHGELLRCATDLTRAAYDRASLAQALDEGQALGARGALFLVVDPMSQAEQVTSRQLDGFMSRLAEDGLPRDVETWVQLSALGLSFARPGQAAERESVYSVARVALVNTRDGGMMEHTLAELSELSREADQWQQAHHGGVLATLA